MQTDLETSDILRNLPGGSELIAWFGGSPNFGDAEVKALILDRADGSRLTLMVIGISDGRRRKTQVTFHLKDMIDISIGGFSHQNVIGDLILRSVRKDELHPSLIGIGMAPGEVK